MDYIIAGLIVAAVIGGFKLIVDIFKKKDIPWW
jgi:hypothetical protein